jgi:hypothetical protein
VGEYGAENAQLVNVFHLPPASDVTIQITNMSFQFIKRLWSVSITSAQITIHWRLLAILMSTGYFFAVHEILIFKRWRAQQ